MERVGVNSYMGTAYLLKFVLTEVMNHKEFPPFLLVCHHLPLQIMIPVVFL